MFRAPNLSKRDRNALRWLLIVLVGGFLAYTVANGQWVMAAGNALCLVVLARRWR